MSEEVELKSDEMPPPQQDLIAKAHEAAARQEAANKKFEELLSRQERLKVENMFAGSADAGQQTETEEQKDIKEAKKWLAGTGFENELFN